ncbi:unnamed protein product, partial [marine sediment metagenome]
DKEELLFLDIETLGLYDSPIIMIGLGYLKTINLKSTYFSQEIWKRRSQFMSTLKRKFYPSLNV